MKARVIGLFLIAIASAEAQFNFGPGASYAAGGGSIAAAQGDFNGDGKLDIAVGDAASNNISIFLGKGDGTFSAGTAVAITGCTVGFLSAGDFAHDGHTDLLAICEFESSMIVIPGAGNGSFGAPITTTLPDVTLFGIVGGDLQNVTVADFNNDGVPDVVLALGNLQQGSSSLGVDLFLSQGDGTFQAPLTIAPMGSLVVTSVLSADFDRDGNQDLALVSVGTDSAQVEVLLGEGNSSFQSPITLSIPVTTLEGSATAADVNGDGLPDIVLEGGTSKNGPSELYVLLGTGGGSFKPGFTAQGSSSNQTMGVIAADLRGTGHLDLVEAVGNLLDVQSGLTLTLQARPGNGDGTFGNPVALAFPAGMQPWPYGMLAGFWTPGGLAGLAFAALPDNVGLSNDSSNDPAQSAVAALEALPNGSLVVLTNTTPPAPALAVSANQLQFTYTAGGVSPARQSVTVSNSGTGTLSWTATANQSWLAVSPASGQAPSSLSIAVLPGNMTPATYTGAVQIAASGAAGSPQTIAVTLTISAATSAPTIAAVVNGASFQPGFESGSWVTIEGSNLSNTNPGRTWTPTEIVNGNLPTELDNTSVTIDGIPAFVYYISPTQLNVQAPTDSATGNVSVVVTNNGQISAPFQAQLQTASPAFFLYPGTNYAIVSHFPDYALVGNPSVIPGTIAAKPGDTLILWATGFGPTNPPTPAGIVVTGAPALATLPVITLGGAPVTVLPSVLSPGSAGLYQIAIQLPASVPTGVVTIEASVGQAQSPPVSILVSAQ